MSGLSLFVLEQSPLSSSLCVLKHVRQLRIICNLTAMCSHGELGKHSRPPIWISDQRWLVVLLGNPPRRKAQHLTVHS